METVLVVDDEEGILSAITDLLELEGYHVLAAGNGREALERMVATRPDLVLTDWMMPVVDGLQLIEQMEATPGLRAIPVILMSAVDLSAPRRMRPELVLIQKPFDANSLVKTVRQTLDRSREPR
jgi:CheY-like chemotaxis protein